MDRPYYLTWTAQRQGATFPGGGDAVLDLVSTNFQAAFGNRNERLQAAIGAQLRDLPVASPKADYPGKDRQSRRLLDLLKLEGGALFYTVSGAEAVENALKMARQVTGRPLVAARRKSYHGASLGALAVTGDWRGADHETPLGAWTVRIPEPADDPMATGARRIVEAAGAPRFAAFCLETITGANGVYAAPETWWRGIQALCDEHGILLILDEVTCGFGRTGPDFGFHAFPYVKPDLVCLGKIITGGYVPFGATWTSERIRGFYGDRVLSCGLTNYAHPLGIAAMGAVLDHFDDPDFRAKHRRLCELFKVETDALRGIPAVTATRVHGLLAAIEVQPEKSLTWERCREAGLHLVARPGMIVLAPPFVMPPADLVLGMGRLRELLA